MYERIYWNQNTHAQDLIFSDIVAKVAALQKTPEALAYFSAFDNAFLNYLAPGGLQLAHHLRLTDQERKQLFRILENSPYQSLKQDVHKLRQFNWLSPAPVDLNCIRDVPLSEKEIESRKERILSLGGLVDDKMVRSYHVGHPRKPEIYISFMGRRALPFSEVNPLVTGQAFDLRVCRGFINNHPDMQAFVEMAGRLGDRDRISK